MSLVRVVGFRVRIEAHNLDPAPVSRGSAPALWMPLAGLRVYLSTLGENLLVASSMAARITSHARCRYAHVKAAVLSRVAVPETRLELCLLGRDLLTVPAG
jgi:hypothetical protein